jgi:NADH:ubiquinone oxidoreductase subunit K
MTIGVQHILIVSVLLFSIGIFGILARRNVLGLLMSIELLFNAVGLNFIAFNRYLHPDGVWGHAATLFVIALAAAEAVVGLALVLTMVRSTKSVLVEKFNILKG